MNWIKENRMLIVLAALLICFAVATVGWVTEANRAPQADCPEPVLVNVMSEPLIRAPGQFSEYSDAITIESPGVVLIAYDPLTDTLELPSTGSLLFVASIESVDALSLCQDGEVVGELR